MLVFDFVFEKFKDKVDKAGKPYFYHLSSVADITYDIIRGTHYSDDDIMFNNIALLHDIFEDTETSVDEIKCACPDVTDEVIEKVKILTRSKEETYMEYIDRVSKDKVASIVKLADLKHNMDITRYDTLDDGVFSLLKRYHKAYKYIIDEKI